MEDFKGERVIDVQQEGAGAVPVGVVGVAFVLQGVVERADGCCYRGPVMKDNTASRCIINLVIYNKYVVRGV